MNDYQNYQTAYIAPKTIDTTMKQNLLWAKNI